MRLLTHTKKGNFSFIPAMLLLCESGGNVIIAQIHRRLFPMLSANVDDALPQSHYQHRL